MSFPFQQYMDYSGETTPGAYWENLEQDAVVGTSSAPTPNQPASISPADLQRQLHTPIEQTQQQQASQEQQQEIQLQPQPQAQHPQIQAVFEPPHTTYVEDRFQPSQFRFDVIDESHFLRQRATTQVGRPESGGSTSRRPPLRVEVDEMRPGSVPSAGPTRVPHGRPHVQASHPYIRPESSGPHRSSSATASGSGRILRPSSRPERASEQLHLHHVDREPASTARQASQSQMLAGITNSAHRNIAPMPAVGVGSTTMSCPAISVWRVNQNNEQQALPSEMQRVLSGRSDAGKVPTANTTSPEGVSTSTPPTASTPTGSILKLSPRQQPQPQLDVSTQPMSIAQHIKRYSVRTDVHFDTTKNLMTVMFELPGLIKADLRIRLSACPYSRVRQLTISGRSKSPLPEDGFALQERKFGDFIRTVIVPYDTKPSDVDASMEDGILTIRMPGGTPAPREDVQDVLIR